MTCTHRNFCACNARRDTAPPIVTSKWGGFCEVCGQPVDKGVEIVYHGRTDGWIHVGCAEDGDRDA